MKALFFTLLFLPALLAPTLASAAPQGAPPPPPATASTVSTDPNAPAYTLPAEQRAKAIAFSHSRVRLHFLGAFSGMLVLFVMLQFGVTARFRDWAVKSTRRPLVQGLIAFPLFFLTLWLLGLPLDLYGQQLERHYGTSVQSWSSYFADSLKGLALTLIFGTLVLELLYLVLRRSPRRWWFYFWLFTLPIVLFAVFISPLIIDPMFNHFEPLVKSNASLVDNLERVVARGGLTIPPDRMFLMRASDKVTTLNAYVTGIGASKRIVVWDTSIAKATPDEIMFIFGHEMGHYVLNHVYKSLAFTALVLLVMFFAGARLAHWAVARWGSRWRFHSLDDLASISLLALVLSVFGFVAEPVFNTWSRHLEHQADIYGQEAMHTLLPDPQHTAQASFQRLGEIGLADPDPNQLVVFWMYSHPDTSTRAAFARTYNPWAPGRQPKYFAH